MQTIKNRFHFSHGTVPCEGVPQLALNGPDFVDVHAVVHLPELLVADHRQVLHGGESLDASSHLQGGGGRHTGLLVHEEGLLDDGGRKLHDNRRGRGGRLADNQRLGAPPSPVDLFQSIREVGDGLDVLVSLGSHQHRPNNSVVHPFGQGHRVLLLQADAKPKEPGRVTPLLLVTMVLLLLEVGHLLVEHYHGRRERVHRGLQLDHLVLQGSELVQLGEDSIHFSLEAL